MEKLETLKPSKKEMDTNMAREFIKKINESCEWPDIGEFFVEEQPNKINKIKSVNNVHFNYHKIPIFDSIKLPDMLNAGKKLAIKIEENVEMFVQLEYLTRGTDPRDVRDGHIKLMSQLLKCSSALWNNLLYGSMLHFTETMPLYNLAAVVGGLCNARESSSLFKYPAVLVENKNMMPLCKFFLQFCHDIGLHIPLVYANPSDTDWLKLFIWTESSDNMGCTGVIAERSDLDSAIDVFINSSVTAPWRLKQIYVQESIFEDFKEALAARSRESAGSDLVAGNKTFLIEYLGSGQAGIPTHAYRTTKELLSLIETPYLSVWAAETALSHEIALRSPACTVWVNEYGSFYGPPRSALSVFNLSRMRAVTCSDKLKEALKRWVQLQASERLEVIVAALKATKDEEFHNLLPHFTEKWCSDDLLQVTDKTICFGIQQKLGIVHFPEDLTERQSRINILKVLLNGNAVPSTSERLCNFAVELEKMGVPIEKATCREDATKIPTPLIMERLKVIRTNYGTIFAN